MCAGMSADVSSVPDARTTRARREPRARRHKQLDRLEHELAGRRSGGLSEREVGVSGRRIKVANIEVSDAKETVTSLTSFSFARPLQQRRGDGRAATVTLLAQPPRAQPRRRPARQPPGTLALVPHAKPIAQRSSALHAPVPQHPPDPATEWEAAHAEAESLKARAAAQGALNPRSSPFDEYVQRKRHEKASSAADYVAGRLGTTREQEEGLGQAAERRVPQGTDDAGGAKHLPHPPSSANSRGAAGNGMTMGDVVLRACGYTVRDWPVVVMRLVLLLGVVRKELRGVVEREARVLSSLSWVPLVERRRVSSLGSSLRSSSRSPGFLFNVWTGRLVAPAVRARARRG